jgi:hypothetical protein
VTRLSLAERRHLEAGERRMAGGVHRMGDDATFLVITDMTRGTRLGAADRAPEIGHPERSLLLLAAQFPPFRTATLMLADPLLVGSVTGDARHAVPLALVELSLAAPVRHAMTVDARLDLPDVLPQ